MHRELLSNATTVVEAFEAETVVEAVEAEPVVEAVEAETVVEAVEAETVVEAVEDEHEAAEIAAKDSGGYDNLKDVRISNEQ